MLPATVIDSGPGSGGEFDQWSWFAAALLTVLFFAAMTHGLRLLARRLRRPTTLECPRCRASWHGKLEKDLLGFRSFICRECEHRTVLPLTPYYAIVYAGGLAICCAAYLSLWWNPEPPPALGVVFLAMVAFPLGRHLLILHPAGRMRDVLSRGIGSVQLGSITFASAGDEHAEHLLNEELLKSVHTRHRPPRASLCVATHPPPRGSILTLCISGTEDLEVAWAARSALTKVFGERRSVEIMFLDRVQTEQVRAVCKAHFATVLLHKS